MICGSGRQFTTYHIAVVLVVVAWLVLLPAVVHAENMSSSNFQIDNGTFGSGGAAAASSENFAQQSLLGEVIVGANTSENYQSDAGFAAVTSTTSSDTVTADDSEDGSSSGGRPLARRSVTCSGADFNTDGVVDLVDFGTLVFFWNGTAADNVCVDINGDGTVNVPDLNTLIFEWSG